MTTIEDLLAAEDRLAEVDCILREFVEAGVVRCDARREISANAYGTGLFDLDDAWHCRAVRYTAEGAS